MIFTGKPWNLFNTPIVGVQSRKYYEMYKKFNRDLYSIYTTLLILSKYHYSFVHEKSNESRILMIWWAFYDIP